MNSRLLADGRTVRGLVMGLVIRGLTRAEAGNVVARTVFGLDPLPRGWTVDELEHLQWMRWLHRPKARR